MRNSHRNRVNVPTDCGGSAPGEQSAAAWAVSALSLLLVLVSIPAWISIQDASWLVRLAAPLAALLGIRLVQRGVYCVSNLGIVFWIFTSGVSLTATTAYVADVQPWIRLGWAAIVVVAGMRLVPRLARVVTMTAVLGTLSTASDASGLPEVLAVAGVVMLLGLTQQMAWDGRRRKDDEVRRLLDETDAERQAARALHDAAVTMGSSTTLDEIVPTMLDSIAEAFDAGVAALLTVDEADRTLRVQSPVLVNGAWVDSTGSEPVPLSQTGVVGQALRSPRSLVLDVSVIKESRRSILGELGLDSALVGPLHLDGTSAGVLVLGEPRSGVFHRSSAEHLDLLTGPAAFVLAQVARHEHAAEMNRRLQEVADMKSDFTSMVIHELRSPLTGIMGALDTIAMPDLHLEPEEEAQLIDAARRQSTRLKRLVEDLLTLSRNEANVAKPVLGSMRLSEVVRNGFAMVDDDRVSLEVFDDTLVEVDPDRMGQVMVNLIENALKYGGGGPVQVFAGRRGDDAVVHVSDHGPGIPDAAKDQVFERFVRLEATRHLGGTGLGLPIVKMFVEGMRGKVRVLDTPGGGATFEVRFPVPLAAPATLPKAG